MRLLILLLVSVFWLGCPRPKASILLMKDDHENRSEWKRFKTEYGESYRVESAIDIDSLNIHPIINPIKIELHDGSSIKPYRLEFIQDSLFYSAKDDSSSINLIDINRILIYDKFTTQDFWTTTGNSFLTGAAVANFPATSRDSFHEAGKSALIGGSVFIVLGNFLEYRTSKKVPIEVIYVGGITEIKQM